MPTFVSERAHICKPGAAGVITFVCCFMPSAQQVCVEPRTSALNMTLAAAVARAPAAVDRYLLPAHRLPQVADVDRRDRQTDGRTEGHLTVT